MGNLQCCGVDSHKVLVRYEKEQFKIHASAQDQIGELKSKIADKKHTDVKSVILAYNGSVLGDQDTLKGMGFNLVTDHLSLSISSKEAKSISITVKNINFTQKIEIQSDKSISDLKSKINKKIDFPTKTQRLIYNGIVLEDREEIAKYGLTENSIVHLATVLSS